MEQNLAWPGRFPKVWLQSREKTTNTALSIRPANSSSSPSSVAWVIFPRDWLRLMPVDAGWPGNLAYINQKGEIVIKSMSTFPNSPDKIEFDLHNYRFCGGVAWVSQGKKEDDDADRLYQQGRKIYLA